jgi:hypothetical protein
MCLAKIIAAGREMFVRGPDDLGVGTSSLARVSTNPKPEPGSFYSPRYMVKGSLGPQYPGMMKLGQRVANISVTGNGSQLAGQMALQELAQLTQGAKQS